MTLDDILAGLFPNGGKIDVADAMITGQAILPDGGAIHVLGITQGQALGVDEAIILARRVIEIVKSKDRAPILFLVDSASQRMSKRDELLGLSEYLSHLVKALLLAEAEDTAPSACSMAAAPPARSLRRRWPQARWWHCPARIPR